MCLTWRGPGCRFMLARGRGCSWWGSARRAISPRSGEGRVRHYDGHSSGTLTSLILKPLFESFHLFHRVWREHVLDRHARTPEDATHGSRQNGVISVNSTVIRPFFENVSSLT
jgi:hypothetical protein